MLLVTGAYFPEFSAGGIQSRAVAATLAPRVDFRVVTTSTTPSLTARAVVDAVEVHRVLVDPARPAAASLRLLHVLGEALPGADVVHVQGCSSKNVPLAVMARAFRRPLLVHLQTARHDEPPAIQAQGKLAWWAFRTAAHFISVSPALTASAVYGGIEKARITTIPNGVDADRFRPSSRDERRQLKAGLGLPADQPVTLFVGVITPDKQPQVLMEAWTSLQADPATRSTLVLVGATNPSLYELGGRLVDELRATVAARRLEAHVRFIEPTHDVERYFRAADLLVMPSLREGSPNVLLEAMACGLPVVASRLPGSTDVIVENGVNGFLVPVGDAAGFAAVMARLSREPVMAAAVGSAARQTIEQRFALPIVAEQWLRVYHEVADVA